MKKRFLFLLCVLSLLLLSACMPGIADWTSEPLPGGYRVWRCSAHVIELCDESGTVVIPEEIIRIRFDQCFIEAERLDTDGQTERYLVSVESGKVFGPYREQEFDAICAEMGIEGLGDWIRPNELPRVQ